MTKGLYRIFASLLVLALIVALVPVQFSVSALAPELFFSEYIEGSSNDKALEIYNGTGAAVDLTAGGYTVQFSFNGGTSIASYALTGIVANDDVYVVASANASATLASYADQQFGFAWFNGDDAVVLWKGGVGGTIIDVFGQVGFDPGSEWPGGGQDDTLRRAETICAGDTNPSDAFDASVEWIKFPNNTFSGLGVHTANCGATQPTVINEVLASTTGTDVEYIELFGVPSASLAGLSLIYVESNNIASLGAIDFRYDFADTDTLGTNGFYLLGTASSLLSKYGVTPNVDFATNSLENSSATVALVETASLSGGSVSGAEVVLDSVGITDTSASTFFFSAPVVGPDGSFFPAGARRVVDGVDTDTAADWVISDFNLGPDNTPTAGEFPAPPPPPEACGDAYIPIYAVQGNGATSPLAGTEVAVEGVVTGDFQNNASADSGDLNGFYVQEPTGDGDPATSDGVFVYAPCGMDVSVGDVVRVRGNATEYVTSSGGLSSSMTEISATQIWNCGTGTVASAVISLPVASIDAFEAYEGMLVTFPQDLYISEYFNFDRFNEMVLTSRRHMTPTAEFEPGSPEAMQAMQDFLLDKITLDDGRSAQNPDPTIHPDGSIFDLSNLFRGGDILQNVTGVVDDTFGLYRIQPTQGANYTSANPRPAEPEDVGGNLTVVSMNTLNFFSTIDQGKSYWICGPSEDMECRGADTDEEFARQRAKLIAAISAMDADVVGLLEIENNLYDEAVTNLVDGLNDAMGAGTYAAVETGVIGGDAIKVALIYKPASVSLVGNYAILDSSVDPRFIDTRNRPALAQTFMDNTTGGIFTVAVNHLKSKGSACVGDPDLGDGAGNCNITRTEAAKALVDWLATDPTGSGDQDFLIIGDLNSYDKEDPIDAIKAGPDDILGTDDDYTDLAYEFLGEYAYSYVFDGQIGYLDYGLASSNLLSQVTGVADWHVNADEPDLIDYDMSFKLPAQDALYAADPFRYSDHDPVIIGLNVCDEIAPTFDEVSVTPDNLWPANHKYVDVVATVVVSDNFDPNPTVTLVSITSSEADEGLGDGDFPDDIMIFDDFNFQLRAERSGQNGEGRTYTINYMVTDACGNSAYASVTVFVPFSQKKK